MHEQEDEHKYWGEVVLTKKQLKQKNQLIAEDMSSTVG